MNNQLKLKNDGILAGFQKEKDKNHFFFNEPFFSVSLPPERTPKGRDPVGVRPFNCNTLSLSSL